MSSRQSMFRAMKTQGAFNVTAANVPMSIQQGASIDSLMDDVSVYSQTAIDIMEEFIDAHDGPSNDIGFGPLWGALYFLRMANGIAGSVHHELVQSERTEQGGVR